jgi:hypothetical protein
VAAKSTPDGRTSLESKGNVLIEPGDLTAARDDRDGHK